jgi:hypothetical protein
VEALTIEVARVTAKTLEFEVRSLEAVAITQLELPSTTGSHWHFGYLP